MTWFDFDWNKACVKPKLTFIQIAAFVEVGSELPFAARHMNDR